MFPPYSYALRRIVELDIDTVNHLLLVWLGYDLDFAFEFIKVRCSSLT
jgi:hypothetical protein